MRYRKLDSNGDYTFGTGADFYVDEPNAVGQSVLTRLKLWRGEWFLDTAEGTPWTPEVLDKYTSRAYDAVIKRRVLTTPGVTSIEDYSSSVDPDTRKLFVSMTINTIYGTTTISTTL